MAEPVPSRPRSLRRRMLHGGNAIMQSSTGLPIEDVWPPGRFLLMTSSGVSMPPATPSGRLRDDLRLAWLAGDYRRRASFPAKAIPELAAAGRTKYASHPGAFGLDGVQISPLPDVTAELPDKQVVFTNAPRLIAPGPTGFTIRDRSGTARQLSAEAFLLLLRSRRSVRVDKLRAAIPHDGQHLIDQLFATGLLLNDADYAQTSSSNRSRDHRKHINQAISSPTDVFQRARKTGGLPVLIPLTANSMEGFAHAPLALAFMKAQVNTRFDQDESFAEWAAFDSRAIPEQSDRNLMSVWLFSTYVWSHQINRSLTASVRAHYPNALIVHGGPDVPSYPDELRDYMRDCPGVDVCVHGEGEETLLDIVSRLLDGAPTDRESAVGLLEGTRGATVRRGDGSHHQQPARDRIADLDSLASPFLSGALDQIIAASEHNGLMETTRGCPYGCTFCDWGSATRTRIRKFSLDRVKAEIDWHVEHQFRTLHLADANFGILPRDVEIAEYLVAAKQKYNFPRSFYSSWAKNADLRVPDILRLLARSGMVSFGDAAIQTTDSNVLAAVERKNIPVDRYRTLIGLYEEEGLTVYTDLIWGLPGSTVETWTKDLQWVTDLDLRANVNRIELLTNSPMNSPASRALYQLKTTRTRPRLITSSTTFDEHDLEMMLGMASAFIGLIQRPIGRYWLRYIRHETGKLETEMLALLIHDAERLTPRYPTLMWAAQALGYWAVPPISWDVLISEMKEFSVSELGLSDDSALSAVLDAQDLFIGREWATYPRSIALSHDVVAWYRATSRALKDNLALDQVPRLRSFGSSTFTVDDPNDVANEIATPVLVSSTIKHSYQAMFNYWELSSPISRASISADVLDR